MRLSNPCPRDIRESRLGIRGKDQGRCSTFCDAQDRPHSREWSGHRCRPCRNWETLPSVVPLSSLNVIKLCCYGKFIKTMKLTSVQCCESNPILCLNFTSCSFSFSETNPFQSVLIYESLSFLLVFHDLDTLRTLTRYFLEMLIFF